MCSSVHTRVWWMIAFLLSFWWVMEFLLISGLKQLSLKQLFRQVAKTGCLWPSVMAGAKGQHDGKQE